ncbi:hypothetical protein [Mesoplasma lactucae]|uniref:Uncharacterized protein n=1 Tax=Mesoplasma lactucae ATCC 49193 TaxID=81460 RepID=A0A291IRQ0_9MOLU|nr:hypothetical protein [Mesoplasma lactucae]ATG97408.1 hypothetical protein CP520_01375 [Mesoplasma lactucae ATCC 49193]ATZ20139.1 hypothetical protein MLACT_v1c03180 [Mesoplasma lactucae ATCC 49193]MCL8216887.1 hypothetical protein [Mesoplasma lactucae ATCC 49193]
MKTFKNVIDESSVKWIQDITKKETENIREEFGDIENMNLPISLPGMSIDKSDLNKEINKLSTEIGYLNNFSDVVAFTNTQKIDFKNSDGQISMGELQKLLGGANLMTGDASLAKILVKIQIGRTFKEVESVLSFIREIQNKIGKTTELSEVNEDDVLYLLNKGIKEDTEKLEKQVEASEDAQREIGEEAAIICSANSKWSDKNNAKEVINIYLDKNYHKLLSDDMTVEQLQSGNTKEFPEWLKINQTLAGLGMKIDFGQYLLKALEQDKK